MKRSIYAINNNGSVCIKIPCEGYEISIACEDRTLSGNSLLTRTDVRVFNRTGDDVTERYCMGTTTSPTLETMVRIQEAILEDLDPEEEVPKQ